MDTQPNITNNPTTTHPQEYQHPSLLPPPTTTATIKEDSPKKHPPVGGGCGGTNDRLKRDEWSEGAVSCLLDAYESKWILRNRAKLKGHDWDDVARHVSARANSTKSPKTQTQCKNKIESMKKRYRSESAAAAGSDGHGSSWVLYPRLDLLLRGNSVVPPSQPQAACPLPQQQQQFHLAGNSNSNSALGFQETSPSPAPQPPHQPAAPLPEQPLTGVAQNSNGSNALYCHGMTKVEEGGMKLSDHESDKKTIIDSDSSTPALYSEKQKKSRSQNKLTKMKSMEKKRRRKGREEWEIAESIRWMAEVVVRSEQARMETMREIEKMRIEAEAKRGEMDLKRTEIIANTQLEIAKLFAASSGNNIGKSFDPSLRIGRN